MHLGPGRSLLPIPSTGTEAWAAWQVGQWGSLGTSEEEQGFEEAQQQGNGAVLHRRNISRESAVNVPTK